MTMISNSASIYATLCIRRTKDEEITLRNSDECRLSVSQVAQGNLFAKQENFYRLVAGTAPEGTDEVYRQNGNLVPSGKVLLDYDATDWRTTVWPQIEGREQQFGILHVERSCRDKLHITVRQIQGLDIEQTIEWFEARLGVAFDHSAKSLSQPCYLVPMDYVLFADEDYYLDTVANQQQDISAYSTETETVTLTDEEQMEQALDSLTQSADYDDTDLSALDSDLSALDIEALDLDIDPDPDMDLDPDPDMDLDPVVTTSDIQPYTRLYEQDADEFQRLVDFVVEQKADLTVQEETWFRLGIACYAVLGEYEGREAFHRLSQFYPNYTYKETDTKFDHIVQSMYCSVGLGTLIFWIKQQGLMA